MKKRILAVSVVVICLAIAASATLAYFTHAGHATNVITTGGVTIEVVENMKKADGKITEFPKNGIEGVMPGVSVSKIVTIKNTGASSAWIRVKVELSIVDADKESLSLDIDEETPVMSYTVLEGWEKKGDYYYYTKPVAFEQSTTELFDEIKFAEGIGNKYQSCTANIIIYAEAVQSANNGDKAGQTFEDVAGWPTKTTPNT